MTHTPWVNYGLLAANVLVYFLGFHAADEAGYHRIKSYMLHPDSPALAQFFTCMFLHGNFLHLAGNMVFLWVFGNAINDRFGHAGYLAFYLAGGVLAGIGYVLLGGQAPVLGASGAISAVAGAYLVLLPRSRVTVLLLLYVFVPFEVSSLYFLAFQFAWNLALTMGELTGPYSGAGGVAYAAHSSGYAFGIATAAALLAMRVLPRDAFDLLNLIRAHHRRGRYQRMVAQGHDPFNFVGPRLGHGGRWVRSRSAGQTTPDTPSAKELQFRRDIAEALARNDLSAAAQRYLQLVQIADEPVLSRQPQLDIANHLMASEQHAAAADAYERFLKHYGNYEFSADICLMLGLLYGRYLNQAESAERYLRRAIDSLHDARKLELARSELQALGHRRR